MQIMYIIVLVASSLAGASTSSVKGEDVSTKIATMYAAQAKISGNKCLTVKRATPMEFSEGIFYDLSAKRNRRGRVKTVKKIDPTLEGMVIFCKRKAADKAVAALMSACPKSWPLILEYAQAHKHCFQITTDDLSKWRRLTCKHAIFGLHKPTLDCYGNIDLKIMSCNDATCHEEGETFNFEMTQKGECRSYYFTDSWFTKLFVYNPYKDKNVAMAWLAVPLTGYRENDRGELIEDVMDITAVFYDGLSCDVAITDYDATAQGGTKVEGCIYHQKDDETGRMLTEAAGAVVAAQQSFITSARKK